MDHMSAQGADERIINIHYCYQWYILKFVFAVMLGENYRRWFGSLLLM